MVMRVEPEGLSAGEIARKLRIAPSSLSFHLGLLEGARLLCSRREQRRIIYSANLPRMRTLLSFLTRDCCGGKPEICADLVIHTSRSATSLSAKRKA